MQSLTRTSETEVKLDADAQQNVNARTNGHPLNGDQAKPLDRSQLISHRDLETRTLDQLGSLGRELEADIEEDERDMMVRTLNLAKTVNQAHARFKNESPVRDSKRQLAAWMKQQRFRASSVAHAYRLRQIHDCEHFVSRAAQMPIRSVYKLYFLRNVPPNDLDALIEAKVVQPEITTDVAEEISHAYKDDDRTQVKPDINELILRLTGGNDVEENEDMASDAEPEAEPTQAGHDAGIHVNGVVAAKAKEVPAAGDTVTHRDAKSVPATPKKAAGDTKTETASLSAVEKFYRDLIDWKPQPLALPMGSYDIQLAVNRETKIFVDKFITQETAIWLDLHGMNPAQMAVFLTIAVVAAHILKLSGDSVVSPIWDIGELTRAFEHHLAKTRNS